MPSLKQLIVGLLAAGGIGLLAGCAGRALPPQVVVVGDLSALGKQLPVPDADHPVYYYPLPVGFKEMGATYAGEKPPPSKSEVCRTIALALAKQHYLLGTAAHPPQQLLVLWWGSMNPEITDMGGSGDPMDRVFFNEREMLALVGAYKLQQPFGGQVDDVKAAAQEDRYFVVIMAYDFAAAVQHQKKLLWMAKMSTAAVGTDLAAVIPALVASGAPAFGRDTQPDIVDSSTVLKEGTVKLAPLEVKETLPAEKK